MKQPGGQKAQRKAQPTEADKEAARRVREVWESKFKGKVSQEALGQRFIDVGAGDSGGISQSGISQYINGHVPMNTLAVLFFASEFGMRPLDVRPDLPDFVVKQLRDGGAAQSARDPPRPPAKPVWPFPFSPDDWNTLSDEAKATIMDVAAGAVKRAKESAPRGRRLSRTKS